MSFLINRFLKKRTGLLLPIVAAPDRDKILWRKIKWSKSKICASWKFLRPGLLHTANTLIHFTEWFMRLIVFNRKVPLTYFWRKTNLFRLGGLRNLKKLIEILTHLQVNFTFFCCWYTSHNIEYYCKIFDFSTFLHRVLHNCSTKQSIIYPCLKT